ncbi:MAG: hypothetical protein KIS63_12860, partial [Caldilineales bacterium]|nr:hypothetical protein [Caldilineales bacterium]
MAPVYHPITPPGFPAACAWLYTGRVTIPGKTDILFLAMRPRTLFALLILLLAVCLCGLAGGALLASRSPAIADLLAGRRAEPALRPSPTASPTATPLATPAAAGESGVDAEARLIRLN